MELQKKPIGVNPCQRHFLRNTAYSEKYFFDYILLLAINTVSIRYFQGGEALLSLCCYFRNFTVVLFSREKNLRSSVNCLK